MKVPQNLIAGLASLLLIATATPALAADRYNPDETPRSNGQILVTVTDGGGSGAENDLVVQPPGVSEGGTRGAWLHCYGSGDPTCDYTNPKLDILHTAVLPNCSLTSSPFCIKSLEVAAPGEPLQAANFIGEAKKGFRIASDAAVGLIEGGRPSLFESANVPNLGGTGNYAVLALVSSRFNHKTKNFEVTDVTARVLPYRNKIEDKYRASYFDKTVDPAFGLQATGGDRFSCAFVEDGNCGLVSDFAPGTRFKIQMSIPSSVGGWFQGRIKDPVVSVTPAAQGVNLMSVEAEPVIVPSMAIVRKFADFSSKEKLWFENHGSWGISAQGHGTGISTSHEEVFEYLDFYRKLANDTASGTQSYWQIGTVGGGSGSSCLQDKSKVLGLVTTNSLGYEARSPAFERGILNYKVTGLHFMPDGKTPVQGTYDLVMRSDVARCLYGFTNAPISATVSVTGGDSSSVATTVVSEKNGWLKMAAYGFTFSEKTLTVRMTQAKAPAVKKTITCVKGKVTKKVTAVNAKCPAGYKKK